MAFELAIVVPTLNESENIACLIDRLEVALVGIHYEVIVVDDDSPDQTAAVAPPRLGRGGIEPPCRPALRQVQATWRLPNCLLAYPSRPDSAAPAPL